MNASRGSAPITIVLPAYVPNGARGPESLSLLATAISSLTGQSDPDWVCRVYDNSADKSVVARLLAELEDPRFQHCPNSADIGLLGSMNRGLNESSTEVVGFLHADDLLAPDYVARVVTILAHHREAVGLLCGAEIIDAEGRSIQPLADKVKAAFAPSHHHPKTLGGDWSAARLMFAMWAYSPSLVLRTRMLGDHRFDETNIYSGDTEFIVDLLTSGRPLVYAPERLYRYRRHTDSGTVIMTKDGTRARLEREFFSRKATELDSRGFHRAALAARLRPFARVAGLGSLGRQAAARSYQ